MIFLYKNFLSEMKFMIRKSGKTANTKKKVK